MDSEKGKQKNTTKRRDRFGTITIRPLARKDSDSSQSTPERSATGKRLSGDGDRRSRVSLGKAKTSRSKSMLFNPLFIIGMLLSGLAAIALTGSYFFVPPAVKGPLVNYLSEQLDHKVTVEKVRFSPLSMQLHLDSIRLQASFEDAETSQPYIDRVSVRLSWSQLLQGTIGVETLRLVNPRIEVVRNKDNLLEILPFGTLDIDESLVDLHLPGWLNIHHLEVANGQLLFRDMKSGNNIQAREINLILPSKNDGNLAPSFRGIVNGVAMQLDSTRNSVEGGVGYYHIQLQSKATDLAGLISPKLTGGMAVKGIADCSVGLVFPENNMTLQQLRVAAKCSVNQLELTGSTGTSHQQMIIQAPKSRISLSSHPALQEFTIKECGLDKAKIQVQPSEKSSGLAMLTDIFQQFSDSKKPLAIQRLQVDQGEIQVLLPGGKPANSLAWQELHLSLTGLHNAAYARQHRVEGQAATVVVNGSQGSTADRATLSFQGRLQPSLGLSGSLNLSNIRAGGDMGLVTSPEWPKFNKGTVDFSGVVSWNPVDTNQWLLIESGTLSAKTYELTVEKDTVLTGEHLVCRGLKGTGDGFACDYLDLNNAVLSPVNVASFMRVVSDPPFSYGTLSLIGGEMGIRSPANDNHAADEALLVFSELGIHYGSSRGQDGSQKRLNLTAKMGQEGEVRVNGQLVDGGRGDLQVTGQNLDAGKLQPFLFSWLDTVHRIHHGSLHVNGKVSLPAADFSGSVRLDDVVLGSLDVPVVTWSSLSAGNVDYKHDINSAIVKGVHLQAPVFNSEDGLTAVLPQTSRAGSDGPVVPDISIDRVNIKEGSFSAARDMIGEGYQPDCQAIDGSIANISPNGAFNFELQGKCDDSRFKLKGKGAREVITDYLVDFENFPLDTFADSFEEVLQVNSHKALASWRLAHDNDKAGFDGEVALVGLHPLPGSPFASLLALSTDVDNTIKMRLDGASTGPELLVERMLRKLQQLKIKAEIDPRLVLPEAFEHVNYPYRMAFGSGESRASQTTVAMEQLAALQAVRPHLKLVVRGNYDHFDKGHLLELLQEEENTRRAYENLKREKLREEYLMLDRQEQANNRRETSEGVNWFDLPEEVLPLPYREVSVSGGSLDELARQRAWSVATMLTDRLGADKSRVEVDEKAGQDGPWVDITLLPSWTD